MGIDQMGIDEVGIDKVGRYRFYCLTAYPLLSTLSYDSLLNVCSFPKLSFPKAVLLAGF